jgi:hypothetical protein
VNGNTSGGAGSARELPARRRSRAREIPIWGTALLLAACLDEAPTFAPRGQIPPFILAGQVDPPIGAIYRGPSSFTMNVPFRSEDVNIAVEANVFFDLVPGSSGPYFLVENAVIPPGNFEETRFATIEWRTTLAGTCHSLTLFLTHTDNYDLNGLPIDDSRAARIVWWTNVGDPDEQVAMADCPTPNPNDAVPGGL